VGVIPVIMGLVLGGAALFVSAPPDVFVLRPESAGGGLTGTGSPATAQEVIITPSATLVIEGVTPRPGRGVEALAEVRMAAPGMFHCPSSVGVTLNFRITPALWADHRERLTAHPRPRFIVMIADHRITNINYFPLVVENGWEPPQPPVEIMRTETTTLILGRDLVGLYGWRPDSPLARWNVSFQAPWVRRRGVGSCWVRLPALVGESTLLLEVEEPKPRWADQQLGDARVSVTSGAAALEGLQANSAESQPPPSRRGNAWTCLGGTWEQLQFEDCSASAAIDVHGRPGYRDAALLFCGLFLSAGVAMVTRSQRPMYLRVPPRPRPDNNPVPQHDRDATSGGPQTQTTTRDSRIAKLSTKELFGLSLALLAIIAAAQQRHAHRRRSDNRRDGLRYRQDSRM
jgi:hypothetical protein